MIVIIPMIKNVGFTPKWNIPFLVRFTSSTESQMKSITLTVTIVDNNDNNNDNNDNDNNNNDNNNHNIDNNDTESQ